MRLELWVDGRLACERVISEKKNYVYKAGSSTVEEFLHMEMMSLRRYAERVCLWNWVIYLYKPSRGNSGTRSISQEQDIVDEILRMHERGVVHEKIAYEIGISQPTVSKIIRECATK